MADSSSAAAPAPPDRPRLRSRGSRRRLIAVALALLVLWLLFFDSHSIYRRVQWHREYLQLRAENERLRAQIDDLSSKLEAGLSDEVVEQIAREQYGMRRPGETVYRVETDD